MNRSEWIQILVGGIILTSLGFLSVNVFSLNSTLSAVDERSKSTDQRVERIAQVLPDIRSQIAWEELHNTFNALVLVHTEDPQQGGMSAQSFFLYDSGSGLCEKYTATATPDRLTEIRRSLVGLAHETDSAAINLARLTDMAAKEKITLKLPTTIVPRDSFILRNGDVVQLRQFLQQKVEDTPVVMATERVNRVIDLSGRLDEISSQ